MQRRRVVAAWLLALFAGLSTAAPSSADMSTPYTANFPQEMTVQTTCPPGVPPPPASFRFPGSDHSGPGTPVPPGTAKPTTEDFTGFDDLTSRIANAIRPHPGPPTT